MKHEDKLKLARKMLTQAEIKRHVSPFQSKWWTERAARKEAKLHGNTVQV